MNRAAGAIGIGIVLVGSIGFAARNSPFRTTVDLGIVTLYRIPVTYVAFGGILMGMLIMLVAGIRADLKVRRILRERLREEDREERSRIDHRQKDLFE